MAQTKLSVRVKISWWVIPYLNILDFLCDVFDTEPDLIKLDKILSIGIKAELEVSNKIPYQNSQWSQPMSKHNDYYQIELLKTIGWGLIITGIVLACGSAFLFW